LDDEEGSGDLQGKEEERSSSQSREAQIMSCIQHPQHRPSLSNHTSLSLQPHITHDCRHLSRSLIGSPQPIAWLCRFIRISRSTQLILPLIIGDFQPIHVRIEMQAPMKTRTSISSSHLLLQADTSMFPGVWTVSLRSAILPKIGMLFYLF
jgi:hypothetical protein